MDKTNKKIFEKAYNNLSALAFICWFLAIQCNPVRWQLVATGFLLFFLAFGTMKKLKDCEYEEELGDE